MAADRRALRRPLLTWYEQHARELPWRSSREPYRVWLSEIMLQQTRVDTVIPYFERFLAAFPTLAALAAAPLDRVLKLWEGLGYYSRARNLQRAAQAVLAEYGGLFPRTAVGLAELPGVGRYSAAAIASIAFDEPVAALDGNIKRVLARLFLVQTPLKTPATTERLWALAETCLARRQPGDWNQALMELGATVCTPRRPRCEVCPVRRHCAALAAGEVERVPVRTPRKAIPHREQAAAVVVCRGRVLVVKRPERGLLGGLWEFPKADLPNGAPTSGLLQDALLADWGIDARVGAMLTTIDHAFTHFTLRVHAYLGVARVERLTAASGRVGRWVDEQGLAALALPRADQRILAFWRAAAKS